MAPPKRLEEYGIIGNLDTCALIGIDGSLDWLCFPHLESPSVFGALLDTERGGRFWIRPATKFQSLQSYAGDTNILQTTFATSLGVAVMTDFMPLPDGKDAGPLNTVIRKVECTQGMMRMSVSVIPRFEYASLIPEVEPAESGAVFTAGGESLYLQSPAPLFIHDGEADGSVSLRAGETAWFSLQYNQREPLLPKHFERVLDGVSQYWSDWARSCDARSCSIEEPWHHLAIRSGLVLKLLSNPDTGAIAAAASTSLPEKIGGVRNWDYRYAWIRDASFTDQALFHLGHEKESQQFRAWLNRIAEESDDPRSIRIMYALHEGESLKERELDHLTGYEGSRPVRVGNAAADQKQLDIYGEMMNAVYDTTRHGEEVSKDRWPSYRAIVQYVAGVWNTEDAGIWEVRGQHRHYVYSKLMCWVALDRGVRIAREHGFDAPVAAWEQTRDAVRDAILDRGFSTARNSFVQSFGSELIDATGLLIAPMGLLPHYDPRVQGTIDAVVKTLGTDSGLVYRYEGDDGLPAGEGCFLLCSFWLIKALALSDRVEEAETLFSKVLRFIGPLGLCSEEIDPESGRMIGNFPQAFSHIGIVNSALYLGIAKGRKHAGPKPLGVP